MLYAIDLPTFLKGLAMVWLGFECAFYFIVSTDWKRGMDRRTETPEYRMDPELLIENILNDVEYLRNYDITKFLEGWFAGAAIEDIKRGTS
jgi:hypothetical protein